MQLGTWVCGHARGGGGGLIAGSLYTVRGCSDVASTGDPSWLLNSSPTLPTRISASMHAIMGVVTRDIEAEGNANGGDQSHRLRISYKTDQVKQSYTELLFSRVSGSFSGSPAISMAMVQTHFFTTFRSCSSCCYIDVRVTPGMLPWSSQTSSFWIGLHLSGSPLPQCR